MLRDLLYSAAYYLTLWGVTNFAAMICDIELEQGLTLWMAVGFTMVYYWFTVDSVVDSVTEKKE
jgi:hypothetical protein